MEAFGRMLGFIIGAMPFLALEAIGWLTVFKLRKLETQNLNAFEPTDKITISLVLFYLILLTIGVLLHMIGLSRGFTFILTDLIF